MALGVDDVLGIASGVIGAANTGYNIYTNKRDFDYQKALQQQIFEREDTAVQRRMADLKAAGLNPNLAAGSAANAGSVVARSSTNDVNMGSALDFLQAANQIKQQRIDRQNSLITQGILNAQKDAAEQNATLSRAQLLKALGFNADVEYDFDSPTPFTFWFNTNNKHSLNDSPLWKNIEYQTSMNKNSADLLQRDVDWYTADKISGLALGMLGLGNSFSGWKKLFK